MPVIFNDKTKEFHLYNNNVSYIFNILKNNHIGHLYYGKKINHRNSFEHLLQLRKSPLAACVYEGDLSFSLDLIKQEYPGYGTGDFRDPAYQLELENGSRITNFEYINHKIFKGKNKLQGLPATYVENDSEATSLEIVLHDKLINVDMVLQYTIFEDYDAISRSVKFINHSNQSIKLNRALSMCVDMYDSEYEMVQLDGAWSRERHINCRKLVKGVQSISSARGASSAQHNPFIAIKRPDTTESYGEVFGFNFVYSGNFLAQVEVDHYDIARVMLGINPFEFKWILEEGESFQTPEVIMVYSDQGLNGMSHIFHDLYRNRLTRGIYRNQSRPILINNWEATYTDFNEDKILKLVRSAKNLGIELFVLDDGWFGKRDDDTTSLGDWFADERKLPNGIEGLANKVVEVGMKFGLWFEPEMVSKVSELYKKHPDWIIHTPKRNQTHARNQYVLDFSRKEVVDYIYSLMEEILSKSPISYIKWDMNRNITEAYSISLNSYRQGELFHRYILGVYSLYERLIEKFPHILFESCSSGGGRFDPGMLYYAPQTWTSDNTDAIERLKIQYGTSLVYPLSSMGSHVSASPNHQLYRDVSLDTRANVAYFGTFGYELDLNKLSTREEDIIKKQIKFFKEYRDIIQFGDFYRIMSPFEKVGNTAWIVVSKDKKKAVVGYYKVLATPNPSLKKLKLKGLNPKFKYECSNREEHYYGDELMNFGLLLDLEYPGAYDSGTDKGDFTSQLYILNAK